MAQVIVAISGRTYRMNCEDGQEAHIEALAADLDQRMERLRAHFGEIGEQRLTMMTALTVVDELAETHKRLTRIEQDLGEMRDRMERNFAEREAETSAAAARLEAATQKISKIAEALARA